MKASPSAISDSGKATILSLLTILFCGFIVPSSSQPVKIIGGPILVTLTFCFYPDWFRSRRGSLVPAFCLTAYIWLCAAVVGIMWFLGGVEL
jgi:hypothetical protein